MRALNLHFVHIQFRKTRPHPLKLTPSPYPHLGEPDQNPHGCGPAPGILDGGTDDLVGHRTAQSRGNPMNRRQTTATALLGIVTVLLGMNLMREEVQAESNTVGPMSPRTVVGVYPA